jgi:predicted dehydrogenase
MTEPLLVGLIGAGPWAQTMHAPTLAAGPETRLAAVWSRRPEQARELARQFQSTAVSTVEELFDRCAAVAFAVPPDIQAELAIQAAQAGKALLLEKPLALTLPAARALADAVNHYGVISQVVLTKRYHPTTRSFLAAASNVTTTGARSCYLHGGFLNGPAATGWRLRHGALLDLGPHMLDLLDAAIGPIEEISATGDPRTWVQVTCRHRNGAVSEASLSGSVDVPAPITQVHLYGPAGALTYDTAGFDYRECWATIRREFAESVTAGRAHPLDVNRGLYLQELLVRAEQHAAGR